MKTDEKTDRTERRLTRYEIVQSWNEDESYDPDSDRTVEELDMEEVDY